MAVLNMSFPTIEHCRRSREREGRVPETANLI